MVKLSLYIILLLLFSCASRHSTVGGSRDEVPQLTEGQEYLHKEFKKEFFRNCLFYGYNSEDREFLHHDGSFAHDYPFGTHGSRVIDSLALLQANEIRKDSLYYLNDIMLGDTSYPIKKRVLQICLDGYESNSLDSIAIIWAKKISKTRGE